MADRKPSEIATILAEILDSAAAPLIGGVMAKLLIAHVNYWREVDAQSDAPLTAADEAWSELVGARDRTVNELASLGIGDLRNAVQSAMSASVMLASDLPGDRQTDPPPPPPPPTK